MGTYIPAGPTRKRSVSDTLVEAEEEHFLDCPNADFFIRLAAALLDIDLPVSHPFRFTENWKSSRWLLDGRRYFIRALGQ